MMKCFLPCFCANSKRTKHFRSQIATPAASAATHTHVAEGALEPVVPLTQQNHVEEPIDCILESKEEQEKAAKEEKIPHIGEKKDEHEEDHEVHESFLQEECSDSLFSLSIDSRKQVSTEIEVNSPMQHPCTRKEEYEAFGSTPSVALRVQHVSSVLNPLENLAQGKPPLKLQKRHKEAKEEDTKLLIVKPEEQLNEESSAIRKVNPNEESSAKELTNMLEENNEEKGKARVWNQAEYRYRDCCGKGYEDVNVNESDLDVTFEDDDPHNEKKKEGEEGDAEHVNGTWVQQESSESLFSISIDSRKRISSAENVDNEVSSLIMPPHVTEEEEEESQGRIADVSSVLNPIENVTLEGRVVKATVCKMSLKNNKENINLAVQDVDIDIDIPISPEPNLKVSNHKARKKKCIDKKQEIGVDTSLSSWLVEPETTPNSMNSSDYVGEHTPKEGRDSVLSHEDTPKEGRGSVLSHEDRPILGALTIEEIRKYSLSTSSRRSRSRSPDETPIIGTVGSYWSHTGQSMDSELNKHQKDTKLKCRTRLERAFEAEV